MDIAKERSENIKTTEPFIKNWSRYVFYNFDKIIRKTILSFWTKNGLYKDDLQKYVKNG